ncbi:MAG: hypothetical protein MK077_07820 [Phycisphaerales bacterium]|nr:hypothetical protein [Phycisphaerales bacterium]
MSRPRATRHGVALLDVMLAALMLAIGLAVTMSLASQSLLAEQAGERRLVASWLADETLALVLATGPREYQVSEPTEGTYEVPFDQYQWAVEIRKTNEWEAWNVKAVVSWQDRRGLNSVEVDTLIAPRQGDPDDPLDWRPLEELDREARTWDEESSPEGSVSE